MLHSICDYSRYATRALPAAVILHNSKSNGHAQDMDLNAETCAHFVNRRNICIIGQSCHLLIFESVCVNTEVFCSGPVPCVLPIEEEESVEFARSC